MSEKTPTFVFGDDDQVYAYVDGKIVAAASDPDELEKKLAGDIPGYDQSQLQPPGGIPAPYPPVDPLQQQGQQEGQPCPQCGGMPGGCAGCGGTGQAQGSVFPGQQIDPLQASPDALPPRATHVVTPNGIKGQILGKDKGLWGDQVTIRLENGRIARFDVTGGEEWLTETPVEESLADHLAKRLEEPVTGTKDSLVARIKELKSIKGQATAKVVSAKYVDQQRLHQIIVTADMELHEVTDALAGLEEAEPYEPPAPYQSEAVEQESLGGGSSTWLDNALEEMIGEAEGQDFDQMMHEGPEAFVAELETPALADGGVVRDLADSYVSSKVAGLDPEASNEFKTAFLARVEEVRRAQLLERKEAAKEEATQHEASVNDGPDEGIFW